MTTHNNPARLGRTVTCCPSCGRRTFKPFLAPDGSIIDPSCGRCNRENNCGYFKAPPRSLTRPRTGVTLPLRAGVGEVSTFSERLARRSIEQIPVMKTPLAQWLCTRHDPGLVARVMRRCGVGATLRQHTVFWLIDGRGRVRSGKIMSYDPTGHRIKSPDGRADIKWAHTLDRDIPYHYVACYQGEQVARLAPGATLYVVESEKTALMLNIHLAARGDFETRAVAVATGGCAGLHLDPALMQCPDYKGNLLVDRDIVLIPDADKHDDWRRQATRLARWTRTLRIIDPAALGLTGQMDIGDIL